MFIAIKDTFLKLVGFPKTEQQLLIDSLKNVSNRVRKYKGGCIAVCVDFVKFAESNELFKEIGLISENDIPYPKIEIMCAGLIALNSLRGDFFKGQDEDFIFNLAKFSFTKSGLILNPEDLGNIFLGTPDEMIAKRNALTLKSSEAWDMWEGADINFLYKILPP